MAHAPRWLYVTGSFTEDGELVSTLHVRKWHPSLWSYLWNLLDGSFWFKLIVWPRVYYDMVRGIEYEDEEHVA